VPDKAQDDDLLMSLVDLALARSPDEREAYLRTACAGDSELFSQVWDYVQWEQRMNGFLLEPLHPPASDEHPFEPGELLEDRFRIVREVAQGGMGIVYEAVDEKLDRRIAIKCAKTGFRKRLPPEVRNAREISHPNVCKIFEIHTASTRSGEIDFLTMEFLDGVTLAERLRGGPLPKEEARTIARQLCAGLAEAHRNQVIHGDLKSNNVILTTGADRELRAVITDFGLARRPEASLRSAQSAEPGGTPDYMAPELWKGEKASLASDVYALGVILYEMVAGHRPFEPGTPWQRRKPPPAPSTIRRGMGRRWDRAIVRCLHPLPGKRFARAADLVDAVRAPRWPVPLAACLLPLLLVALIRPDLVLRVYALAFPKAGPVQVLAILPFERIGGGPEIGLNDYLAEQIQKNRVIRGRWLVFTAAEVRQMGVSTPSQARAVFGASHALAGTITYEPELVTFAGRLLDTKTSQPAGSFQKTCPLDNTVCLQDGMLLAAAGVLVPHGLSSTPPAISAEAFPYYLQGLHYLRQDSLSYDLAISFLQKTLEKDPLSVQPRVALADAYMLVFRDRGDKAMLAASRKSLDEVLATHPGLPDLHASLGSLHRVEGRYDAAARELLVAVQADPFNHVFRLWLGQVYDLSGRDADAVAEFQKAIQLQPRYWEGYLEYARFDYRRGRFREAAGLLERLIEWAPDHAQGLGTLGAVYVAMGRNTDAERVSRHSCELTPGRACYVNLGIALQRQRRTHEAIAEYERALGFGAPPEMLFLNIADAYAYVGKRTEALGFFRRAAARAEESLKINLKNSGVRAILAYCKAQIGDRDGATFEIEQALQDSPEDKDVRKYGVLAYESIGQRDKALQTLRGSSREVLEDLELAWGTEQLRRDPNYPYVAMEVRNK
jgi:serine/threonine protein kinase